MKCEINKNKECTAKSVDDCEHIWNCQNNRNTRKIDEIEKLFAQTLPHINELTRTVNSLTENFKKQAIANLELRKEIAKLKGVIKNVGTNTNSKTKLVK